MATPGTLRAQLAVAKLQIKELKRENERLLTEITAHRCPPDPQTEDNERVQKLEHNSSECGFCTDDE